MNIKLFKKRLAPPYATEFVKFIVAGGINTLATYLVYLLALVAMSYMLAYTLSYCVGILLSYYLNSRFVFRRKMALRSALQFPLIYAVQYGTGLLVLWTAVTVLGIDRRLAPAINVACTIPLTFLMTRTALGSAPRAGD